MSTQQAKAFVSETFPTQFNKVKFLEFIRNLLNKFDESKAQAWNSQYVKDAFKDHVSRFERLGTYTSPDQEKLDVLIVHLTSESKLERARTAIRNFVADHLKTRDGKDAALVAFVSPTEKQWRFSYVKMEYAAVEKEDGKIGVQTKLTPARRSSYIVGEGESCHTAQSRFLDLLQDTENNPTLMQIEEAFSVEAVTREFFEQYKELFLKLKDDIEDLVKRDKVINTEFATKNVSTADFAKKLMGQIVFLYFLQKKGWLGVAKGKDWGEGTRNFLRQLYDGKFGSYKNFFNEILEPLFYDTLATDRGHEAWCSIFKCRIPFLNGGLFEPIAGYNWKKTDITIPNSLFSNSELTEAGDKGTGILDVFDRYNFTVNEAEPLEKEVAIDPEMLGKVFENLLEVKERKSKGSFYTPREIVHYMCQESLINYLDTAVNNCDETVGREKRKQSFFGDEKAEQTLLATTIRTELISRSSIETFIHSGDQASHYEAARVEGTSYQRKLPKAIETHARLLDDKLADIIVCDPAIGSGAFPVGMMQEIVRARSALTSYFNDIRDRTAYHFKRHAIQNCLYGVDIDSGAVEIAKLRLWLSLVVDEDDVKHIKPLPNLDYKIVVGNSLYGFPFKSKGLMELEEIKKKYFDATEHSQKAALKNQIDTKIQILLDASEKSLGYRVQFDFQLYFSEVFHKQNGFDIVIGNPPYLNVELVSKTDKEYYAATYRTFYKRFDVFGLFFELGLVRLIQDGTVAFIVPQQIFNNLSYKKLRELILANQWLHEVLYLGDEIFNEASNDVCVLFLKKPSVEKIRLVNALDFNRRIIAEVPTNHFEKFSNVISFSDDSAAPGLFDKLYDAKHLRIREQFDVFQGIVTGNNEAFILTQEQAKATGIERELLKPILHGRDFERWTIRSAERLILYVDGDTKLSKFPNAEKWLQKFRPELKKRRECLRGIIPWFSLQWPRDKAVLDCPSKIAVQATRNPRLKLRVVATVDEGGIYGTQGVNFIVPKKKAAPLYFVLGILNSSLINHLYATKFLNVAIKAEYLKDTPIPIVSPDQQKPIEYLVKRILLSRQHDAGADTSALEQEIDELVYALYELTPAEIKVVERSSA